MALHHEIQTTAALDKIEAELKQAHLYARMYGKGWELVEELQRLHAQYIDALAKQGHQTERVLAHVA